MKNKSVLGSCCASSDFLVNFFRQLSFPPVGIHTIIPVLTLWTTIAFWKCFTGVSVFLIPYHCVWYCFIYSSLLLQFSECKCFSKGSVCICRMTVVSKRVRAAFLHQWLVFQAYICGEINAECWWERYLAFDSSSSYTQTDAHTLRHACTHSGWRQHWFEEDTLAVITECLTCYFKCICSCAHIQTLEMQNNSK